MSSLLKFNEKSIYEQILVPGNSYIGFVIFRFFIWLKMFKDAVGKSLFFLFYIFVSFVIYFNFIWDIKNFSAHHIAREAHSFVRYIEESFWLVFRCFVCLQEFESILLCCFHDHFLLWTQCNALCVYFEFKKVFVGCEYKLSKMCSW